MGRMFQSAAAFAGHGHVSHRLVGYLAVMDMGNMFDGAAAFNQPIGGWDTWNTSQVVDRPMWSMFSGAAAFNQAIGRWDTSKVCRPCST